MPKRKSKTPAKNRWRKSRGPNPAPDFNLQLNMDDTIKSTVSTNSYQTINSTSNSSRLGLSTMSTMSSGSNKFGFSRTAASSSGASIARPVTKLAGPPQCLSAKFAKAAAAAAVASTPSATFLEEENLESIENFDMTVRSTVSSTSITKSRLGVPGTHKFNFQHPDAAKYQGKLGSNDINYSEFSVSTKLTEVNGFVWQ